MAFSLTYVLLDKKEVPPSSRNFRIFLPELASQRPLFLLPASDFSLVRGSSWRNNS